jgi:hypothetical protein
LTQQPAKSTTAKLLSTLLPILLTLVAMGVALEWGLRHFYQLIPQPVCAADELVGNYYCQPYFEYDKPIRLGYRYQPNLRLEGWWDPADPHVIGAAAYTRPSERSDAFWLVVETDEMGFPNREPTWQKQYDIVITGDSFVTPFTPQSWIDLLAEQTDYSILTLGAPGWGPLNQLEAVRQYGLDKRPQWVIMLYFEGNDLLDVIQYTQRSASGRDWREYDMAGVPWHRRLVTYHLARWLLAPVPQPEAVRYRYPVTVNSEAGPFETILGDPHLALLSADYETLAGSAEFQRAAEAIVEMRDLVEAQNGRFLLVYVPTKAHISWSRIWDPVDVNNVLERSQTVTLSEGDHGRLQWAQIHLNYDTFTTNIGAQGRLLDDFARAEGIEFLNLAPSLFTHMLQDGEVYHYADSHWNQAGNILVAEVVAAYLAAQAE